MQEVHPYTGGTSLRWWYNPTLVVLIPPTSPLFKDNLYCFASLLITYIVLHLCSLCNA